ncbi:hypothetical protein V2J09_023464 [Rumex salicifolius]
MADDKAHLREIEGKLLHDPLYRQVNGGGLKTVMVYGPVIVGAGPSGLAVAACLRARGVPSLILERSNCIASLWQLKTYDRLRLHLPKQFCELPLMEFPAEFPTYPSKQQFLEYLEEYAARFEIRPAFDEAVDSTEYDAGTGFWRVRTGSAEYVTRWVVAATGENAEVVAPEIEGAAVFGGEVVHTSGYKNGARFKGKKVLVVGCGNSGMEVCLDLCHHQALPSIVVRDAVHVLPREMFGRSTFGLSMWLLKWFPITLVDKLLLVLARVLLGDTTRLGLARPNTGPLQLKNLSGKTPVLDVGTLDKIKRGDIKVYPAIKRLKYHSVEFIDGKMENFDAIILATGYKSNVPSWLKKPFPNGWKGEPGLYAVGFTKRGLLGASMDAMKIAEDIERNWRLCQNI